MKSCCSKWTKVVRYEQRDGEFISQHEYNFCPICGEMLGEKCICEPKWDGYGVGIPVEKVGSHYVCKKCIKPVPNYIKPKSEWCDGNTNLCRSVTVNTVTNEMWCSCGKQRKPKKIEKLDILDCSSAKSNKEYLIAYINNTRTKVNELIDHKEEV